MSLRAHFLNNNDMLPKEYRLQRNIDFQKVFKRSKIVYTENLILRVSQEKAGGEGLRFGFIVSNKIDKRATRRNSLKRELREIIRGLISELKSGYDIVITVKKDFPFPYDQAEIKKQVLEAVKKSGIYARENIDKIN